MDNFIEKKFYFPESNREEIATALKNLQLSFSNEKKQLLKKQAEHVSTQALNDLFQELQDSKEKCKMLEDELIKRNLYENEKSQLNKSRRIEMGDVLNNIKEAIEQNAVESNHLENAGSKKWKKTKQCTGMPSCSPSDIFTSEKSTLATHFKLNTTEIPFIAGKSTGRSHSISANLQEVLSLLKKYNLKLCKAGNTCCKCKKVPPSDRSTSLQNIATDCVNSLKELKTQLCDEYQHLRTKHLQMSELAERECDSNELRQRVKQLKQQLDLKSDQIKRISEFLDVETPAQYKTFPSYENAPENSKPGLRKSSQGKRTLKQGSNKQQSLELLRNLKEIQSSLR